MLASKRELGTAWIAQRLGCPVAEGLRCLALLSETAQIHWTGTHWTAEAMAVDTRPERAANQRLETHWAQVGVNRIARAAPGPFSYDVFTVSQADFERIRTLHLTSFRERHAIVADPQPAEVVGVANVPHLPLEGNHSSM